MRKAFELLVTDANTLFQARWLKACGILVWRGRRHRGHHARKINVDHLIPEISAVSS